MYMYKACSFQQVWIFTEKSTNDNGVKEYIWLWKQAVRFIASSGVAGDIVDLDSFSSGMLQLWEVPK